MLADMLAGVAVTGRLTHDRTTSALPNQIASIIMDLLPMFDGAMLFVAFPEGLDVHETFSPVI